MTTATSPATPRAGVAIPEPAPASQSATVEPAEPTGSNLLTTTELCLLLLAVIGVLAFMRWAEAFLVPLLLGILLSYTLNPAVSALEHLRLPRALGAALMLGIAGTAGGALTYVLADDVAALTELVPQAASKVRAMVRAQAPGRAKPLANLQKAATELDRAAAEVAGAAARPAAAARGSLGDTLRLWLIERTSRIARLLLQISTAFLIAYFLLSAGDVFRRKVARLAGPTLTRRRIAVEGLNQVNDQIQGYMAITAVTNVLIAFGTWALLAAIGVQHAAFWGVAAGLLHIIPYIGSLFTAFAVGIVALVQFGDLSTAALAAGGVIIIAGLLGVFFNTWLQARTSKVNTVTVMTGVLFFGWLWGGWGLILAVPILTAVKAVAERVSPLTPLAEYLRE